MAEKDESYESDVSSLYQSGDEIHCFMSRKSDSTSMDSTSVSSSEGTKLTPMSVTRMSGTGLYVHTDEKDGLTNEESSRSKGNGRGRTFKEFDEKLSKAKRSFVETKAYAFIRSFIKMHGKILITGGPGEGKSTVAIMLCDLYCNEGFNVCNCKSSSELGSCISKAAGKKTIHLFENIFSPEHSKDLEIGQKNFKLTLSPDRVVPNCILIFTSQIYDCKKDDSWIGVLLKGTTVDITSIHLQSQFRIAERVKILRRFPTNLSTGEITKIAESGPFLMGFPETCLLFSTRIDTPNDPMLFFKYPHLYLSSRIGQVMEGDQITTATFMLLLLTGGKLRINDFFKEVSPTGFFRSWKNVNDVFPELNKEDVFSQFSYFYGTFLKEENGLVSFINDIIYDACVFEIDKRYSGILWDFYTSEPTREEYPSSSVYISQMNTVYILQSIAKHVKDRHFSKHLSHQVLRVKENVGMLWDQIEKDIPHIIHMSDAEEGGTFLYWVVISKNIHLFDRLLYSQRIKLHDVQDTVSYCVRNELHGSLSTVLTKINDHVSLNSGFDINYRDPENTTLMMLAACNNDAEIVLTLQSHGADSSLVDVKKRTCLHMACMHGNEATVRVMLQSDKVEVNASDSDGMTPVMYAAERGYMDIVECFRDTACVYSRSAKNSNNILHMACIVGNLDLVKFSMTKRISIDSKGQNGMTPAMISIVYNHLHVLKYLVNEKASMLEKDSKGNSVLHLACSVGDLDIVKYLISTELVAIHSRREDGLTAFDVAMKQDYQGWEIVRDILLRKHKPDMTDGDRHSVV